MVTSGSMGSFSNSTVPNSLASVRAVSSSISFCSFTPCPGMPSTKSNLRSLKSVTVSSSALPMFTASSASVALFISSCLTPNVASTGAVFTSAAMPAANSVKSGAAIVYSISKLLPFAAMSPSSACNSSSVPSRPSAMASLSFSSVL